MSPGQKLSPSHTIPGYGPVRGQGYVSVRHRVESPIMVRRLMHVSTVCSNYAIQMLALKCWQARSATGPMSPTRAEDSVGPMAPTVVRVMKVVQRPHHSQESHACVWGMPKLCHPNRGTEIFAGEAPTGPIALIGSTAPTRPSAPISSKAPTGPPHLAEGPLDNAGYPHSLL